MLSAFAPEQMGSHLARFLTDSQVLPIGIWDRPARVGGVQIGGFSFALIESPGPMQMEAAVNGDHFLLLCCLRGSIRLDVDGDKIILDAGYGVVTRPRRRMRAQFSRDCARLAVRIDLHIPGPDLYPEHQVFALHCDEMRPWFEGVRFLFTSPSFLRYAAQDPALVESMEGVLVRLLQSTPMLTMFSGAASPAISSDVRRAEAFIHSEADRDIALRDIARAAEVSARTLQSNFIRYRNMTPTQYLRNVRLERARELLLGGKHRVLDAALESGFSHLGRFANRYRARFGESPSRTLRQTN